MVFSLIITAALIPGIFTLNKRPKTLNLISYCLVGCAAVLIAWFPNHTFSIGKILYMIGLGLGALAIHFEAERSFRFRILVILPLALMGFHIFHWARWPGLDFMAGFCGIAALGSVLILIVQKKQMSSLAFLWVGIADGLIQGFLVVGAVLW